jgi:RNA polymerase sigma factor (sigma-70 family)
VITLTKAREQVRFHRRQKRSVGQEIRFDRSPSDSSAMDVPDPNTDRPEAEDIADRLGELLGSLTDEERGVVELKLQDLTNDEIAVRLNCSERTVRRIMKRVSARFSDSDGNEAP